jgi:tetratricopeptide (TPR) repeat protein
LEQVLSSSASPKTKSSAHLWLGYLLLSEDEADMGESHFLEALQLNPKDPAATFNLGRAYLRQEKYQQALEYFQLAELELPSFWLIHIYSGWAKSSLKVNEEASKAFKLAVSESKDRWATYFYQAIFYFKNRELELARETLMKMLGRDPQYEKLSPIPLGFFQERSNYDEYLNAFDQILEKAPTEERLVGKLYLNYLNNPLSPSDDWRKMDALANRTHNILARLLSIKMMLSHSVQSGDLKTSLSKLPTNLDYFGPYAYVIRGQARERLNQLPEAQLDYKKALALDPDCASAMWYQFNLYRTLHRSEEAKSTLDNLVSSHPNYIPALEELSNIE